MTICFFGMYKPDYSRNRVLREGFERLGHTVIECRTTRKTRGAFYLGKYFELLQKGWHLRKEKIDLVIVCFPGQRMVWLARLLFGRKIVWDAFLSSYDTNVFDRKFYRPHTINAKRDWLIEWLATTLAPRVLLDTDAHSDYFVATFRAPREKFARVWIGADDAIFHPVPIHEPEIFTVSFHGTFIPLQGLRYIVEAADLLRNEAIDFEIAGEGQESGMIKTMVEERGLERFHLLGSKPIEEIPTLLASAHISIGIFGDTEKTRRVIPNKVYEAMAVGRPIITADTPALRELMPDTKEVCAIPAADPAALAAAIRALRDDSAERARLATAARALFERALAPERIVADLLAELKLAA
jgi:glycosyltransferase involved in cell wall biosynthesis